MVEVYGKKDCQIKGQDPAHRRAYSWVNAECKEMKERSGGKARKKKNFQSQGGDSNPTTLTLQGKAPVCIATFTLHKDPWLQLLYKYHEGYILNSIAQYPFNMMERERESVIELNLKVQKTINIAEYEMTTNY